MKAIILSAGRGERLSPLTDTNPKPMVPLNGKPNLEYLVELCKRHGVTDIAVNTSYLADKITSYFQEGADWGTNLKFSFEPELLGTSGALNNFRDFLDEDFFVIYGDNVTNLDLKKMAKAHKKSKAFCTLYLYHEQMADEKTTPGCVLLDEKSYVNEIIENPSDEQKKKLRLVPTDRRFTNAGIYLVDKRILDFIPQGKSDFAKQIFPELLRRGLSVYGFTDKYYIREIGQMPRYLKALEELQKNPELLN